MSSSNAEIISPEFNRALAIRGRGNAPAKILLVLTEFPPRIGGMQTHALALANYLVGRGYPIEVLTYRANRHEERDAGELFDKDLSFPVHRVLSRLGFWHNIDLISEHAKDFGPDLVYCSTVFYGYVNKHLDVPVICRSVGNDVMRPWIAYPFRFGSKLLGSKLLEQPVYDLFKRFNYPEWIEVFFRKKRYEVMRESARRMKLVMANSDFTADLLHDLGIEDERIQVLVGGVDTERFWCTNPQRVRKKLRIQLDLPPKCFLLTTACRMVAKKGVDFLIRSFADLNSRMPDAHLLIIGAGKHEKRYRRMARRLGVGDNITFAGRVPQSQIHRYYWASNLFVLASRVQINEVTGLRDAETMGRVLCEANAAGLPVVAARSGGIPSVVHHERNGLLFEPDNAEDFIGAVTRVRKDKSLRARMIDIGRRWARDRFDWSVVFQAHEEAFGDIVGTPPSPVRAVRGGKSRAKKPAGKKGGRKQTKPSTKKSSTRTKKKSTNKSSSSGSRAATKTAGAKPKKPKSSRAKPAASAKRKKSNATAKRALTRA